MKTLPLLAALTLLSACATKPVVPYTNPAPGTPTAKLRIVTNGDIRGAIYANCLGDTKVMAQAGRFHSDGQPKKSYPQIPPAPPHLEMPPRLAPQMVSYAGTTRQAEGYYKELVAEYEVPAGAPFLLESLGLAASAGLPYYFTCPVERRIYTFDPNKSYEAFIGLYAQRNAVESKDDMLCSFSVYELPTLDNTTLTPLKILDFKTPAGTAKCQ